jgi:hypothetical protein
MKGKPINLHRKELEIEGGRTLFVYSFTDKEGRTLEPEPKLAEPAGNLDPLKQAEDRKE